MRTVVAGGCREEEYDLLGAADAQLITQVGDLGLRIVDAHLQTALKEGTHAVDILAIEHAGLTRARAILVEEIGVARLMSPRLEVRVVAAIDAAGSLAAHRYDALAGVDLRGDGVGRGEAHGDIPTHGAIGRQTHDNHLVGVRGEDLAVEGVVVALILHCRYGALQIKVAAIALRLATTEVANVPIAQWLVTLMQATRPLL